MRNRVIELMSSVFDVDSSEIDGGVIYGKFSKWDSLRHMNLIVALEEEFDITLTEEEVTEMLSLDLIVEILKNRQSGES